ncbi:MAG: trehalose-phosphatase [Myxococcales bacterium]|nr:MAG: trehalose-phosphatase [Myxococcales bacterium]
MLALAFPDDAFFARVKAAPRRLLMLDYDGTLAPFCVERDLARPHPGVEGLLRGILAQGETRLAIVSGRPLADVERLLPIGPPLELWGSHGWERRTAGGEKVAPPLPPGAPERLNRAKLLAEKEMSENLEAKPAGLALHWRGKPAVEVERMRNWGYAHWRPLTSPSLLELLEFDGGIELRVPSRTKGTAVEELLAESAPETLAVFLGDDRTDEDAFQVLRNKGYGILVNAQQRDTFASYWINTTDRLLEFLKRWDEIARKD